LLRWRFLVDPGVVVRPQPAATLRPMDPLHLTIHALE
jgi:hypothetical protein